MAQNSESKNTGDGVADAMATTAIISIIVLSMYIWLSGMPS
ncbi:MAG: methionine synthase [Halioglobus sp.]|nr:methionine synthase [Halioglobus sp.]